MTKAKCSRCKGTGLVRANTICFECGGSGKPKAAIKQEPVEEQVNLVIDGKPIMMTVVELTHTRN